MPRRENPRTDLAPLDQSATGSNKTDGLSAAALAGEKLYRLADMVATGEATFPDNLPEAEQAALFREVRRRRRDRLIRFVACAIARKIWQELQTQ